MMQPQLTTEARENATAEASELLALVEAARTNTLCAQRIADEIENTDEVNMAEIVTIARRCHAALKSLDTLSLRLSGQNDHPPVAAAMMATLPIVDAQAA